MAIRSTMNDANRYFAETGRSPSKDSFASISESESSLFQVRPHSIDSLRVCADGMRIKENIEIMSRTSALWTARRRLSVDSDGQAKAHRQHRHAAERMRGRIVKANSV